ncbi:hypothetical protein [[Mycobacterium] crassicus]|uniref:Major tail protein n=1 Tax=[Mycobacterium] crassicus TaxID=2872309 RepID=A0ABU5XHS7_9MYCO|nr:hypothetical protein [Mycolicibacter sp. MYC098]MEB3021312.1 hypothetical protein [Mycolicibacter sp. MYC098]
MTRPSTGTTWKAGGFNDVDPRFLERGGLIAALIRDARGADTDLSPHNPDGSVKFSPFAADGQLRDDLFAFKREGGFWIPNPDPNESFHLVGAFKEGDGPKKSSNIDTDDYMIEQDNFPFDSDITKEDEPFSFTGVETAKPLLRRLRNNLPLSLADGTLLVETPGGKDAGWGKPIGADPVERQVLLLRARRKGGKTLYTCTGYALSKLNKIGDAQMGKKDADAAELTFKPLPDGIFMAMVDGEYVPVIKYDWIGGDAWVALGGVPVFGGAAPVAAATTSGKATLAFDTPTGGQTPYSYGGDVSTDNGSTWSAGTLSSATGTVSGGTTTLTFTGLSAGSVKLRAKVTDANGKTATSQPSGSVTIT